MAPPLGFKAHYRTIFSSSEQKLLNILERKKMTIAQLSQEFYKDQEEPLNAVISIASTIRRINKKCAFYNKTWTIAGKGAGRGGRTVWRVSNKTVWKT